MVFFSSSDARFLPEVDLNRIRKDGHRTKLGPVANASLNIVLLAALWGVPYYFFSLVLTKQYGTTSQREAIIGVWQLTTGDGRPAIEFTRGGEFRLSRGGIIGLTAHYRFDARDDVVLYDLNFPFPKAQHRLTVSITGGELSVGGLDWLPGGFGQTAHFKREN